MVVRNGTFWDDDSRAQTLRNHALGISPMMI